MSLIALETLFQATSAGENVQRPTMPQSPNLNSYDLERFVAAQRPIISQVYAELRAGRKKSHWMWFIFPQLIGLGQSELSRKYGILSLAEAELYLKHSILGTRIRKCTHLMSQIEGASVRNILGSPDDLKFHSSMTLFAHATTNNKIFIDSLTKYFSGEFDQLTLSKLALMNGST
jgi:uncharacterized protein (DUF1810 family)